MHSEDTLSRGQEELSDDRLGSIRPDMPHAGHEVRQAILTLLEQLQTAGLRTTESGELVSLELTPLTPALSGRTDYPYGSGIARVQGSLDDHVAQYLNQIMSSMKTGLRGLCSTQHTPLTPNRNSIGEWVPCPTSNPSK